MDSYSRGITYQTTDNAFKSCTAAFTQKVHLIQAQYSYLARQAMPEWGNAGNRQPGRKWHEMGCVHSTHSQAFV